MCTAFNTGIKSLQSDLFNEGLYLSGQAAGKGSKTCY